MENPGRLIGQIAAESGCTAQRAKIALYLSALSSEGRSVDYAAHSLRRKPDTIKRIARDFMLDFSDYRPFAGVRAKGVDLKPRAKLAV